MVVLVADQHGLVAEPDGPAVAREHPVLGAERLAGRLHAPALLLHPLEILGGEPIGARRGVGQPLPGGEAQDRLDLRAHVQQRRGAPADSSIASR